MPNRQQLDQWWDEVPAEYHVQSLHVIQDTLERRCRQEEQTRQTLEPPRPGEPYSEFVNRRDSWRQERQGNEQLGTRMMWVNYGDPLGPFPNEITYASIPQQEAYIVDDINISPQQPLTATEVNRRRERFERAAREQRMQESWEQYMGAWNRPEPPKPKVIHLVSPIFCREVVK